MKITEIMTDDEFRDSLEETIGILNAENMKSGWLEIPIEQARLVEVASELGFDYHHAVGKKCVLKRWLRTEEEEILPSQL